MSRYFKPLNGHVYTAGRSLKWSCWPDGDWVKSPHVNSRSVPLRDAEFSTVLLNKNQMCEHALDYIHIAKNM